MSGLIALTQDQVASAVVRDMIHRGELSSHAGVAVKFGFDGGTMTMFLIPGDLEGQPGHNPHDDLSLSPDEMVN